MNRIYRLVFNRSLGLIQVVAEIAKGSGGKGSNAGGTSVASLRPLSFALWTMLGFVSVIPVALPQVVGDRTAPGNQQPTVITAPNGVPLVNIQTPSTAGVSRNTYSQFDVDRQGLILNNSRTNAQTQLSGWVQGNPWLATGTAKVILNEVNSSSPSYLNGYIEVAGTRAAVVIANPAGIQANGGGFINASRVTLTTGAPMLSGGTLEDYRVQGGAIVIDGAGLDTTGADYTDLIARSLQLNGGLWANQLQATLGTSVVSADHSQVTATTSTGTVPTFALDASALGGMYANKITLVGTEHGVGARNAGTLGAQAGDLVVTVNGRIENTGALQSSANTHVSAAGGVVNAGTISATRELTIDTPWMSTTPAVPSTPSASRSMRPRFAIAGVPSSRRVRKPSHSMPARCPIAMAAVSVWPNRPRAEAPAGAAVEAPPAVPRAERPMAAEQAAVRAVRQSSHWPMAR
ncbi:filamentous hemagglutinin N-terminal domain-containing protein [Pseudoxanthomonas mexicana]|uniref:two-partner secretion domain-containing protein n=1 Tax=Pseudoxanthomonas mexicana TaxID=128785 RepID=UPI001FD64A9F|nr:filamentous hemagglutinin N-terminal domain-containing protein [Pseudoxanthomonas mexicana]UOV06663.1 filamentous hemagglutinin N-terminal domain-containing protein [Pseudoxanthomonas mexicana]